MKKKIILSLIVLLTIAFFADKARKQEAQYCPCPCDSIFCGDQNDPPPINKPGDEQ